VNIDLHGYWPWWLGAIALAAVTVGYAALLGRAMGCSGSWVQLLGTSEARRAQREAEDLFSDPTALNAALLEATEAQFGRSPEAQAAKVDEALPRIRVLTWIAHGVFLASIAAGALLAATLRGGARLHFDLGDAHAKVFGSGWHVPVLLGLTGIVIGFGARMAGGCQTGHGLTGTARLQVGSIAALATFLGTAVVVSIVVERVLR
jgi:uncharacterized membrane protein YedE/YeeE